MRGLEIPIGKIDYEGLSMNEVRGIVLDCLNQVESLLGRIIQFYFRPEKNEDDFRNVLLSSSILNYNSKVKFLFGVGAVEGNELKQDLHKLGNIRNAFAHNDITESILFDSEFKVIDTEMNLTYLNSQGKMAELIVEEKFYEFKEIYDRIVIKLLSRKFPLGNFTS